MRSIVASNSVSPRDDWRVQGENRRWRQRAIRRGKPYDCKQRARRPAPECRPSIGDETEPSDRLLFVVRELTRGGAAYLTLRHARRLCERYSIDVLVTGPADDDFLGEFPESVAIYRLGEFPSRPEGLPLRFLHQLIGSHHDLPPFRRSYRALLATSIFPDWEACAVAAAGALIVA